MSLQLSVAPQPSSGTLVTASHRDEDCEGTPSPPLSLVQIAVLAFNSSPRAHWDVRFRFCSSSGMAKPMTVPRWVRARGARRVCKSYPITRPKLPPELSATPRSVRLLPSKRHGAPRVIAICICRFHVRIVSHGQVFRTTLPRFGLVLPLAFE